MSAAAQLKQAELIGRRGCAHFWTKVTRSEVAGRAQSGLPELGKAELVGFVCLLCRAVREDTSPEETK